MPQILSLLFKFRWPKLSAIATYGLVGQTIKKAGMLRDADGIQII